MVDCVCARLNEVVLETETSRDSRSRILGASVGQLLLRRYLGRYLGSGMMAWMDL